MYHLICITVTILFNKLDLSSRRRSSSRCPLVFRVASSTTDGAGRAIQTGTSHFLGRRLALNDGAGRAIQTRTSHFLGRRLAWNGGARRAIRTRTSHFLGRRLALTCGTRRAIRTRTSHFLGRRLALNGGARRAIRTRTSRIVDLQLGRTRTRWTAASSARRTTIGRFVTGLGVP
jgi:hypothetical protein